jgi:hypothetical protein
MSRNRFTLLAALALAGSLAACHGLPLPGGGGGAGGGGGTATVSFVMVADTPPAAISVVSFRVTVTGVQLTSSGGTNTTLTPNSANGGLVVDLMRLQSDSAFLGALSGVPTGTNSTITVSFANPVLSFVNTSGAAITNVSPVCQANAICTVTFASAGAPVISFSQAISGNTGFGIDFNLSNAITLSNGNLSLNFTNSGNTNVVTAFTLPRQNSNLSAGQLDLIEDFTGVVSISGQSVTVTPPTATGRAAITAATSSTMNLDPNPSGALCAAPAAGNVASCVSSNQIASMDAILKADGTLVIQEIEPLLAAPQDVIEGAVVSIGSATQFTIVASDFVTAAQNSLIGSVRVGDPVVVNIVNNPNPFLVDTKGLPIQNSFATSFQAFAGATNTGALHLGQTVALHVTAFTPANGNTAASASTDTITLRWSRLTATAIAGSSQQFGVTAIPAFFGFTQASSFGVETFTGTPGLDGVTNLDGVPNGNSPSTSPPPLAIRALFLEDPSNSLNPAFFAAKVRQH